VTVNLKNRRQERRDEKRREEKRREEGTRKMQERAGKRAVRALSFMLGTKN